MPIYLVKLMHFDNTKKRAYNPQIVQAKENLKLSQVFRKRKEIGVTTLIILQEGQILPHLLYFTNSIY